MQFFKEIFMYLTLVRGDHICLCIDITKPYFKETWRFFSAKPDGWNFLFQVEIRIILELDARSVATVSL